NPRDLVRPPARAAIPQLDDRGHDVLGLRQRARARAPALLDQTERTVLAMAPQPLVASLSRDAVLTAERRDVCAGRVRLLNEFQLQAHDSQLFPGHALRRSLSAMS